ncbi:MAG TPA: hypothetical protein VFA41_17610 [Ktedonobacteraceae bacterium]|jgi:hypothetical protein|nr:hypothetical protein [Ktedonobacteraceae bacterium]
MATRNTSLELVNAKLAAFDQLQTVFEECFQFVQRVHGQQRFTSFPLADIVRYLHSLWVCECKDRLLSVYRNIERYEGKYCLQLLKNWQEEGDTASVVDFLQKKLDMLPLGEITHQIHLALHEHKEDGLARRLIDGRRVMLNRGFHLMLALDSIFSPSEEELIASVREICEQSGLAPEQIEQQLAELESMLYAYLPHQKLAQRNMEVMNRMGVTVMNRPSDQPGERSWRVLEPTVPPGPYAEQVIEGYLELTLPYHNNVRKQRLADFPEQSAEGPV